jgi:hypothetical protein
MIAADRQQRSREHGELMPGDCGGRLKKEKRMVISVPSARGGELHTSDLSPFPTKFRVSSRPLQKVQPRIDRTEARLRGPIY